MEKTQRVKQSFDAFVKSINICDLDDEKKDAVNKLICFWNSEIDNYTEDDFYNIKKYHTVLNGYLGYNDSYKQYISNAANHRLNLTAKTLFNGFNATREFQLLTEKQREYAKIRRGQNI